MCIERTVAAEFVPLLSDLLTGIAALGGVVIAWWALDTWKAQVRGQAAFELAKNLMTKVNKLARICHEARTPLLSTFEFPDSFPGHDNATPAQMAEAYRHVFFERWKPIAACYKDVAELVPECETMFRESAVQSVIAILKLARTVRAHQEDYADLQKYGDVQAWQPGEAKDAILAQLREAQAGALAPIPQPGEEIADGLTRRIIDAQKTLGVELRSYLEFRDS